MILYKDPGDDLDFGFDWLPKWLPAGDAIVTSTWTITGPDSTLTQHSSTHDDTSTTVWLAGGTPSSSAARYRVTNHITTAQGRTAERTLVVSVADQ